VELAERTLVVAAVVEHIMKVQVVLADQALS
jgi:hypothetical protein